MGQLSGGKARGEAVLSWPHLETRGPREGHWRRQWDCVSVGEYVCTLKGGGRRGREKEEGAAQQLVQEHM